MIVSGISLASLPALCQNYQNRWTFDEVLTKTILHSFLDTVWTLLMLSDVVLK